MIYCPKCGSKSTRLRDESLTGGELRVTEDFGDGIEYYDEAVPYECKDCRQPFYLGKK